MSSQKSVLSTFFRSEIQATDCTFSGCSANSAATSRLGAQAPVACQSSQKSRAAFSAWRTTLVAWWPRGSSPNACASAVCASQVSGCQLESSVVVNAQRTLSQPSPACTRGLAVT